MSTVDTPQIDRTEPELDEPAAEARPAAIAAGGTHNLIAELRNSMAVVARSGAPRRVRIRTYRRHALARLSISLFVLLGYLIILAGVGFFVLVLVESSVDATGRLDFTRPIRELMSLDGILVTRLLMALGVVWAGFFSVAVGQSARAQSDGADYARQALALHKAIAEGVTEIDTRRRLDRPQAGSAP